MPLLLWSWVVLYKFVAIIGGSCHKYHFCRDKSFVATNTHTHTSREVERQLIVLLAKGWQNVQQVDLWTWFVIDTICVVTKRAGVTKVSLAGAATSLIFVLTIIILSRQIYFSRDKHMFVATKHLFCQDKSMLVATKQACFCRDKQAWFCRDKRGVLSQKRCLARQKCTCGSSRQWYKRCNFTHFVRTPATEREREREREREACVCVCVCVWNRLHRSMLLWITDEHWYWSCFFFLASC